MQPQYSWQNAKQASGYSRGSPGSRSYGTWSVLAVVLAVLFHVMLFFLFERIELTQLAPAFEKVVQVPAEREEITIDELTWQRILEEERPAPAELEPPKEPITYEEELPVLPDVTETIKLTPEVSQVTNLFANAPEPVMPEPLNLEAVESAIELDAGEEVDSTDMTKKLLEMSENLSNSQAKIQVSEPEMPQGIDTDQYVEQMTRNVNSRVAARIEGKFTALDDLLGPGVTMKERTDVMIPTDLLFDFSSYTLKEEAKLSLMKLGMIILANPNATFVFKGFTDSIPFRAESNQPGPKNNQELSLARAEAVKQWLVDSLGLEGFDLQTRGYGSADPLVRPTGNRVVDRTAEAINRRVEVEIIQRSAR